MRQPITTTNILVPEPGNHPGAKAFRITRPDNLTSEIRHFPDYFPPDYPALMTNQLIRELLTITAQDAEPIKLYIDAKDFLKGSYPWLPFTLALHAIIVAPQATVYFRNTNPVDYSELLDYNNQRGNMECIRNFCVYLQTTDGNRPKRVFEQAKSGKYRSFAEKIFPEIMKRGNHFSSYYYRWIQYPYDMNMGLYTYYTHPFDHLPVHNLTKQLKNEYLTKSQWKEKGYDVPGIEQAAFMHDQINTVRLTPYWHASVVTKSADIQKPEPSGIVHKFEFIIKKDAIKS